MDYLLGTASMGYMGWSLYQFRLYQNFIATNPPNLLEGRVFTPNPLRGIFKSTEMIYENIVIQCGREVTTMTYKNVSAPDKIATGVSLPVLTTSTEYTKHKHPKSWAKPILISSGTDLELNLDKSEKVHKEVHTVKEKVYSNIKKYYQIFDQHNIPYDKSSKLIINEKYIENNSKLCVFGDLSHNSVFDVKYMGPRDFVLDNIRKNVYGVRYGGILLAATVLVGSIVIRPDSKKHV